MTQYQCFVDLGSSSTKAVFNDGTSLTALQCPPWVADLPPSELDILRAQGQLMGSGLESVQYIQLSEAGPAYALGTDAQGRPSKKTSVLPKSELARYRVLGMIGEIAYRNKWDNCRLDVGVALPFNEYLTDYNRLLTELDEQQSFTYRDREISLELVQIKILPEAAGLVQWRKVEMAQRRESMRTFVVIMFGHRDLSFLLFRQGKPPQGEPSGTERLGYQRFLMTISQDLPCDSDDPFLYDALIRGVDQVSFPTRPSVSYPLTERRQRATAYYWDTVRHRLDEWLAAVDVTQYEVLVSGGAAAQFRPYIDTYFQQRSAFCTLNWLEDLKGEVAQNLSIPIEIDQMRFGDCYGGAKWMALKFQK